MSRRVKMLLDKEFQISEKDEVTVFAVNRNLEEDVELTTDARCFFNNQNRGMSYGM